MRRPILLLFANLSLVAQEAGSAIRVVRADEGWLLGSHRLKAGEGLAANVELKGTKATPLVLGCTSELWLSYTCKSEGCTVHACAPASEAAAVHAFHLKPAGAGMNGDLVGSLLRHQRDDARTLGVRGGGNPNDAVLLQSGGAVHWGPALTRVLEGTYCLRLIPLPTGDARTFTIEWDRNVDREGAVKVPELAPGIYTLEKGDVSCRFADADSAPAWVVVAPEAQFAKSNTAWKAYAGSLQELANSGADPVVLTTVRRAILSSLDDSLAKK